MPDDVLNRHPVAEMLEAGEPEVTEYWLHEPDIDQLIDDRRGGLIDEDTFNRQSAAWKEGWIKKLEAWNEGMRFSIDFPKDPAAPRVVFTEHPIEHHENFPPDLMPQKRGGGRGGPTR